MTNITPGKYSTKVSNKENAASRQQKHGVSIVGQWSPGYKLCVPLISFAIICDGSSHTVGIKKYCDIIVKEFSQKRS